MDTRLTCALALLAGMTSHASADFLWGVNGHPMTAYPGISVEEQIGYVANLGMKSYRVNIPDIGRADELDRLVRIGKGYGIEILPVLTPGDLDLAEKSPEELYRIGFDFAAGLARRFGGDIKVFELGNELENFAIIQPCEMRDDGTQYPCDWGPAGGVGPLEYYGPRWVKVSAALKGMSEGLHSVDPTLKRAIGTAGWGHVGAFHRMRDDGIGWDISVWHVYGQDPEWALDILQEFGKPIWVTELNNPLGSQNGEEEQARNLARMMNKIRELGKKYRVEAAHIYELFDEPYWGPPEDEMGLVTLVQGDDGSWRTGQPKRAYFAARNIIGGPATRPAITRHCELSRERDGPLVDHQIEYSYCLVLGRWPDKEGATTWRERLESGEINVYDLVSGLGTSDEFNARFATKTLTNEAYVSLLYRILLLREPDRGGLSAYVRELNAGNITRDMVVMGMVTSTEFAGKHPSIFPERDVAAQK